MSNIATRILKVLHDNGLKPTPWEEANEVSRGYLNRAAEKNINIGSDIVEKILLQFPGLDVQWLITGKESSGNTTQKPTSERKDDRSDDFLAWVKPFAVLKDQIEKLQKEQKLLKDKIAKMEKEKPEKPAKLQKA